MGITVAYRGRLADLTRIEDFEDRVLDFALEVGGLAQIWRSRADDCPERMVRGLIVHVAPGQESTSLLISPEGWLVGLIDIKDAELGKLTEPPWCFVKTQFGSLEGHVALIEMLRALQREFMAELEVSDEGGYWETSNLTELVRRRTLLQQAIEGLAAGLERHGLSREAAEDPDILCRRIERIAAQVQRILGRPAEHPPVTFPDDSDVTGAVPDPQATEALWDEMFKHNRRQQERLQRSVEEHSRAGMDDDAALEQAFQDLALDLPGEETEEEEQAWAEDAVRFADSEVTASAEDDAPFKDRHSSAADDDERHPLLEGAMALMTRLHEIFREEQPAFESALRTLFQGAGDVMGGLAQALPDRDDDDDDREPETYGLRVVQLKQALRGAAFARGSLFLLRPALSAEIFDELYRTLAQLEKDTFQELGRVRSDFQAEE